MSTDQLYMYRALQLAKIGRRKAMPNPSVGAVVVCKDTIIGEGFTSAYGGAHAEVNAIASVKDQSLLKNSTLYVTLEPCSHFGKTPPCADLIIKKNIKKVVIGCIDPFAAVAGKGIQRLKEHGVEVVTFVLEKECQESNQRFFTFHLHQRPYIILKWAQSADGFIAPDKKNIDRPVWLSNVYSRQLAHKWRGEEMAILVGKQTVLDDNPSLTTRDWEGPNPIRLLIDKNNEINNQSLAIFDSVATTYRFTQKVKSAIDIEIDFNQTLQDICNFCYQQNIQSIIIEGGRNTLQSFIDADLWDEARVFEAPIVIKKGIEAPVLKNFQKTKTIHITDDCLHYYAHQ